MRPPVTLEFWPRATCVLTWACLGIAGGAGAQALPALVDTLVAAGPAVFDQSRERAVMVRQRIGDTSVGLPPVANDVVVWDGTDWAPILPPINLPTLSGFVPLTLDALAYDTVHGRLLALGNLTMVVVDGATVTQVLVPAPSLGLFGRIQGRRLAHDAARDDIVVFGGFYESGSGASWVADTYVRHGSGLFALASPASRPPARSHHALVYDERRQRTLLFGGAGPQGALADTWEWDGATWLAVAAAGPAPGLASGAFDLARQQVAICASDGTVWSFDGTAWLPRGTGPGTGLPRPGMQLTFDGGALVRTGGFDGGTPRIEVQRLVGASWSTVPTSVHPPTTAAASLAYDSVRRELVCLHSGDTRLPRSTWVWNGRWRTFAGPTPGPGPLAFDTSRGEGVLVEDGGGTWTWDGSTWATRTPTTAPPPRANARMAYDGVRQCVVLYGGGTPNGNRDDTWSWDGLTWHLDAGTRPSIGLPNLFVYDPSRQAIVMASGNPTSPSTWEWAGQWSMAAASAPARAQVAAFDPTRNRLVAFEEHTEHEWTGAAWSARPTAVSLHLRQTAMATDSDRRRILARGAIPFGDGMLTVLGPSPAQVEDLGGGCGGPVPLTVEGRPAVGATVDLVTNLAPGGFAIFAFGFQPSPWQLEGCTVFVDGSIAFWQFAAPPSRRAASRVPIPADGAWRGLELIVQAVAPEAGTLRFTRGLRLRLGD
jgi:hypothetical protein